MGQHSQTRSGNDWDLYLPNISDSIAPVRNWNRTAAMGRSMTCHLLQKMLPGIRRNTESIRCSKSCHDCHSGWEKRKLVGFCDWRNLYNKPLEVVDIQFLNHMQKDTKGSVTSTNNDLYQTTIFAESLCAVIHCDKQLSLRTKLKIGKRLLTKLIHSQYQTY